MANKKKKVRVRFRKNRQVRTRKTGLTREFAEHGFAEDDSVRNERLSGKGDLSRKRTVVGDSVAGDDGGFSVIPEVDPAACLEGRVLEVKGLISIVRTRDGRVYQCAVRRLLKTLSTDQRHIVAAGDRVQFRPDGNEGLIQRVEQRTSVLSRTSRRQQHVLVANVDQVLVVASAAEPGLKPHLIDRFLVAADQVGIEPIICINKI